jgi:hypothetical protein
MAPEVVMRTSNECEIEIARNSNEIGALRDDWQRMILSSGNLDSPRRVTLDPSVDIDFHLTMVQHGGGILRSHVTVLKRGGFAQSLLVGRVERRPLQVSLGYKRLSTPPIRILTLTHGGMVGEDSEQNAIALVNSVQKCLRDNEADAAWFYGMELDSPFYQAVRNADGWGTRDYCSTVMRRWRIQLPVSYEELYRQRSSNTRHNLKRYSKRLREALGDQLIVRSFRNATDVDTILSDTEAIAAKTYQRGLGVGFAETGITRELMTLAAKQGWLRAHILYAGSKPIAFWNGFLYHRTLYTGSTGFDPELSDLRPGTFLLERLLEQLCDEKAADRVDFGFGDAQYKRDWCDHEHFQVSQYLFAPTIRGMYLNAFHNSLGTASRAIRKVADRSGLVPKLKKAWRNRLAHGPKG